MIAPAALTRKLISLIQPQGVVGLSKVRVGNPDGDGGYVMVDSFDGIGGALSVGIGGDVSWDLDIANRGIEVFQYDHTVSGPPVPHPLFHFVPAGLAANDAPAESFLSLDGMVAATPGNADLIAKLDVEGAEWAALSSVREETMLRLAQLVIELHEPLAGDSAARVFKFMMLAKIVQTHAVVHVHANNYAGVGSSDGVLLPDVLEVTFLRRNGNQFSSCSEEFPTDIDRPNNPDCADIPLTGVLSQFEL